MLQFYYVFGRSMILLLDSHAKDMIPIVVGITSSNNAKALEDGLLLVTPGTEVQLEVTPAITVADPSLANELPEDIGCRFNDNGYTQASCKYQCAMDHLGQAYQCQPWNMYQTDKSCLPVCNAELHAKFVSNVTQVYFGQMCSGSCLPDCESVQYMLMADSILLDVASKCRVQK